MKHRKYLLKTCVLLLLFVCASAAPSVYAQDGPPESQKFGVGFKVLAGNDVTAIGANARFWTESPLGFEVGWARDSEGISASADGISVDASAHIDVIPMSALYTLTHVNTESVYIRPYVGGGINIARGSFSAGASGYGGSSSVSVSATKVGAQGFAGAEFTFKQIPKLSFGGDLGILRFGGNSGFAAGLQVHYYLK